MRRKGILALVLVAMLTFGVGAALAAKKYSTNVVFLGNDGPSLQDQTLYGNLKTKSKCRGARKMRLYKDTSYGLKLIDAGLSSFNGAWALRGDLTGTPDLVVKAKRDKRKHGRIVCKSGTLGLSASSAEYPRVR